MASDYGKLVKALRYCAVYRPCSLCPRYEEGTECFEKLHLDAADAIEELQADMKTYGKTAFDEGYAMGIAKGEEIADKRWQAEVKRLVPKRGEWSHVERVNRSWETDEIFGFVVQCSICGNKTIGESIYCPNCGAKMLEVQDESMV